MPESTPFAPPDGPRYDSPADFQGEGQTAQAAPETSAAAGIAEMAALVAEARSEASAAEAALAAAPVEVVPGQGVEAPAEPTTAEATEPEPEPEQTPAEPETPAAELAASSVPEPTAEVAAASEPQPLSEPVAPEATEPETSEPQPDAPTTPEAATYPESLRALGLEQVITGLVDKIELMSKYDQATEAVVAVVKAEIDRAKEIAGRAPYDLAQSWSENMTYVDRYLERSSRLVAERTAQRADLGKLARTNANIAEDIYTRQPGVRAVHDALGLLEDTLSIVDKNQFTSLEEADQALKSLPVELGGLYTQFHRLANSYSEAGRVTEADLARQVAEQMSAAEDALREARRATLNPAEQAWMDQLGVANRGLRDQFTQMEASVRQ